VPPHEETNAISRAVSSLRRAGTRVIDLTAANPTSVGLDYPTELLAGLSDPEARGYDPQPLGLLRAREAVAADYRRRGVEVDAAQIVLSASTSEAYSWLFKLLCNPGDGVLVPAPSYPLFEHLTRLESVQPVPYHLAYHGRWEIDFESITAAPASVRAIVIVSPNNPTGSYVSVREAKRLISMCRERGWALIADEVFAEFPLDVVSPATEVTRSPEVLSFTLGGASKSLGLPQVKLAWTIVDGPARARDSALAALELIADTFLSVGTPVQVAASSLFHHGASIRDQIRRRITSNLAAARQIARHHAESTMLEVEGGWSMVVRVPAVRSEEALVLELLARERVLVHPGYFFDFPHEAFLVVSLLPQEEAFADAFDRVLACASRPSDAGR
jgi:alanine-synthesizing transaminase